MHGDQGTKARHVDMHVEQGRVIMHADVMARNQHAAKVVKFRLNDPAAFGDQAAHGRR